MTTPVTNSALQNPMPLPPTPAAGSFRPPVLSDSNPSPSYFRQVFQTSEQMRTDFVNFLETIFYQLDTEKVMAAMDRILSDASKSDDEIYTELQAQIGGMRKRFAPLWQIWSLRVLKKGMGKQAAELMQRFEKKPFHDYMEIYDRRYCKTLRQAAGLPLDGQVVGVTDSSEVGVRDRLQAGALFSRFPYTDSIPLNDEGCVDPLGHPEQTHKAVEFTPKSIDIIACLGGLHHIPEERVEPFVRSLHEVLRPGAVILLRDHDVVSNDLKAIASVVHSFVNASDGVSLGIERAEIRNFQSMHYWSDLMKREGFIRTDEEKSPLVLKDDPTANGMVAFVRAPQNLKELREATLYRNCLRPKDGTRATWIEWGNVRSSKQYAEFIQNHHAYAFDYLGHLRQHWKHFYHYIKESLRDGVSLKNLVFSDNFAMNLFILFTASIQCAVSTLSSLPSIAVARCRWGSGWREVSNLTELEKYNAEVELEYSKFIDTVPFYKFDYLGKIKPLWRAAAQEKGWATKLSSGVEATLGTLSFLAKAAISAPVRAFYTAESNLEPDTVTVLMHDPEDKLNEVAREGIRTIYTTPDHYKLVSIPRYRPFTALCQELSQERSITLLEIGSQSSISVDVLLPKDLPTPRIEGAHVVYEMDKLQDPEKRRYATYQVAVDKLMLFQRGIAEHSAALEYVHE